MSNDSQNHGLYKAGMEEAGTETKTKQNMNKYFALILVSIIIGGLLVNPRSSDATIALNPLGSTLSGSYGKCTDNITINAPVNITNDRVTNVGLKIFN